MIISYFPVSVGSGGGGTSGGGETVSAPDFTYTGTYETVTDDNGWKIKFLTSGTLTFDTDQTVDLFAVGGGGAGGNAYSATYQNSNNAAQTITQKVCGGGGGGGYTCTEEYITMLADHAYDIVIGAGGTVGQNTNGRGETTKIDDIITARGGYAGAAGKGGSGGSGGGRPYGWYKAQGEDGSYSADAKSGGSDGNRGGGSYAIKPPVDSGPGQGSTTAEFGEAGGYIYAGGGAGGNSRDSTRYDGGVYGGGKGASKTQSGTAGTANTGGGGGGASLEYGAKAGGSGILIIRNHRT